MSKKKEKRGRPIKWKNNPFAERNRKVALEYWHSHREERLAYARRYHKRIKDYADKHGISFDEAKKILAQKRKEKRK